MFVGLTQINDYEAETLVFFAGFMALCSVEMRYVFHISMFWQTRSPLMPRADGRSGLRVWWPEGLLVYNDQAVACQLYLMGKRNGIPMTDR